MSRETLLALAERCEAAEGADRELDGSIWWATRSPGLIEEVDPTGFVRQCIERDGSAGIALAQFYDSANPSCLARLAFSQPYTASIDAALTLVPEGWEYGFHSDDSAYVYQRPERGGGYKIIHDSAVCEGRVALALCAAALRARAAAPPSQTGEEG